MKYFLYVIVAVMGWTVYAWAEDVPRGTTVMTLSASSEQKVTPDVLNATLSIEVNDPSPQKVQNLINAQMRKALGLAEKQSKVDASTGHYQVYERYEEDYRTPQDKRLRKKTWYGQQTISLSSRDHDALYDLIAKLQADGMTMKGLSFSISREVQRQILGQLQPDALEKIQDRAKVFADQLDKLKIHFAQINMDGNNPVPLPKSFGVARLSMAADMEMAAPVAKADDQELSVSINAVVWLSR